MCMKRKPHRGIDWIRSKPWLACAGLFSTLMAIICGFGGLMMIGISYNVINTIIPFLIIAIGIDDMFIITSCWEQSDENQTVPQRMSQTLSHAGVAVTITNVTDILSFAIGCINFREGLDPGNLVTEDHYISKYFDDIKEFWKAGPQLHIGILNPPDLANSTAREAILSTVAAFENTDFSLGREGTVFFLLEYLNYLEQLNVDLEDTAGLWKHKFRSWLKYTGGASQWESDVKINEITGVIEAFRFSVALKNIVEPNQHKLAAKLMRSIADAQPFHVVVYYEAFPFADQYLIILPAMVFNVSVTLLCMTVVSLLMVPSLPSGVIIFVSIVSINVGVFGYMTLWGVNLDAISMISIIMSIGFAVDLSGHIVYAFVTSHGDTNQRVIGALQALGWPIFQGASSTIAGISVLYTVDAYIILVFFKTIWLTMAIGAVHGLFFIPVFLSVFPIGFFCIPKTSELS
ncbi:unnamed protein product [Heligmosomoides polygyrus]|uniref:SSD domain-containing protein n=1 Tax=Heligmosomoides polygyrus TaxID=6339 RepID=A0A3P7YL22_HELPZ|nr:unnamed protein product [Heligmosomoides polygyrus]